MKKLLCLLACAVLLLTLTGCADGTSGSKPSRDASGTLPTVDPRPDGPLTTGEAPNTDAPTTSPTESAPASTEAPTTEAPTTEVPTTEVPTTETPTTEAPTTEAPTTEVPTTEAPTTEAPTTEVPTTEVPTTEAPTTEAPTTEAPTTEVPTAETPTTEAPTEAPTAPDAGADELNALRQRILDSGEIGGVIFLGFADGETFAPGTGAWQAFLAGSAYGDLDFLRAIPDDRIVNVGGTEVYCVIPLSEYTAKEVTGAEMDEQGYMRMTDQIFFEEVSGDPFVLRCNVSDIVPNAIVNLITEDYTVMWEPALSLNDSRVVLPPEGGLCDLTTYN